MISPEDARCVSEIAVTWRSNTRTTGSISAAIYTPMIGVGRLARLVSGTAVA
jgi:hypothetical protein